MKGAAGPKRRAGTAPQFSVGTRYDPNSLSRRLDVVQRVLQTLAQRGQPFLVIAGGSRDLGVDHVDQALQAVASNVENLAAAPVRFRCMATAAITRGCRFSAPISSVAPLRSSTARTGACTRASIR